MNRQRGNSIAFASSAGGGFRRWPRSRCVCLGAALGIVLPAFGQTSKPESSPLVSLSAYSSYITGLETGSATGSGGFNSDAVSGGAVTVAWAGARDRSDWSLNYTGSYMRDVRYSALSGFSHQFSINTGHRLADRWDLRFSAAASIADTNELLFSQNLYSTLSSTSASFSQITGGMLAGSSSNSPVNSLLTGTQAAASPALLLYGGRTLSAAAQLMLAYHVSPRTTVQLTAGGIRNQALAQSSRSADESALLFQATTGSVGLNVAHSLNSRTEVSVGVQTFRALSGPAQVSYNSATMSLSRVLSQRWFASVGGGGMTSPGLRSSSGPARAQNLQYVANGTIGFKTYENTFFASWSRSADTYGLGSTAVIAGSGGWTWARPGRSWSTGATFSQQQMLGSIFSTIDAWQADFRFQRALSSHAAVRAEYAYMRLSGPALFSAFSPSAIRLTLTWSPGIGLLRVN